MGLVGEQKMRKVAQVADFFVNKIVGTKNDFLTKNYIYYRRSTCSLCSLANHLGNISRNLRKV